MARRTVYISVSEGVMGGQPVVTGTRIPVERIRYLVEHGYTDAKLKSEFRGVSIKKIRGAISESMQIGLQEIATN